MPGRPKENPLTRYRTRRTTLGPWTIVPPPQRRFAQAVVIPALAERDTLFPVLESLALQQPDEAARTLVIVVVNQREDHDAEVTRNNAETLDKLRWSAANYPFALGIMDAASAGLRLPPKHGVGLARRIGMDAALEHLDLEGEVPPVLCSLDADSPVAPDYLEAVREGIGDTTATVAILEFAHPLDGPNAEAIIEYETWLRCHALGLAWAASPYGFHTIGSAFACTAMAYALADGMPQRLAGEDFYFLQKAAKVAPVIRVPRPVVYPAARASWRVPFGTGARIATRLEPDAEAIAAYAPASYRALRQWLATMHARPGATVAELYQCAIVIDPALSGCLETMGFRDAWNRWRQQPVAGDQHATRIKGWFDGFRTLKAFHYLRAHGHPMVPLEACVAWLADEGCVADPGTTPRARLLSLRAAMQQSANPVQPGEQP